MIISTVAHPKANSYLSLEELDERLSVYPETNWSNMSDLEKENIARIVTAKIDNVRFLGEKFYVNQSLEFPRKYDARVISPVYSSTVTSEITETTQFNMVTESGGEYTIPQPTTTSFQIPHFPIQNTFELETVIAGNTVILQDDGNGSLLGAVLGSIDYETRTVTLPFVPESDVTVRGDFYYSNILESNGLKFDIAKFLPNLFSTGSVHIIYSDGTRHYADIITHNISTGRFTFSPSMERLDIRYVTVFAPYFDRLKDACFIQIASELGGNSLGWNILGSSNVRSIKIGDTMRTYGNPSGDRFSPKIQKLADKYRIHPIVLTLLAPFTIYGKMESFIGTVGA